MKHLIAIAATPDRPLLVARLDRCGAMARLID